MTDPLNHLDPPLSAGFRPGLPAQPYAEALGPLLLALPCSFEYALWGMMCLMGVMLAGISTLHFQEKTRVHGYLDLKPGLLHVKPKASGIVMKRFVHEGALVKRGERLFEIRTSFDGQLTLQAQHIAALVENKMKLNQAIEEKQLRLAHYHLLLEQHYLSAQDYDQQASMLRQMKQELIQLNMTILQAKLAQSYLVRAPIDGRVSHMDVNEGMAVQTNTNLLTLRPQSARWVAYLAVPAQAARYIHASEKVHLRYDTYPIQQYGGIEGSLVKQAYLLSQPEQASAALSMHVPYYLVEVHLPQPYLHWEGKTLPLYQGMPLEGILSGRSLSLFTWWRQLS